MTTPIHVYLPCEVFPVLVRYGSQSDITTLESLILRAIREEEHSIVQLTKMFGVNDRMMYDAVRGLLQSGHLVIDFETLRVYLSKSTIALFDKNELDKFALSTAKFEQRELMFDLVVGRVLPLEGDMSPPTSASIIPYRPGAVRLEHVTNDKIFGALHDSDEAKRLAAQGMKVWEASIAFPKDHGISQIRFK